jgi:predicted  nucleic acid-binding Zn-ribbon protein
LSRQELAALLAVQDLDLLADQLRHRRAHLPARSEIAELDRRIGSADAERVATEAVLADVAARQAAAEAELAEAERRAASLSTRLYDGSVTASRELSAMSAELDHLKGRSSTMEDAVLALMEERDPLEARSAQVAADLERLAAERRRAAADLQAEEAAVDAELAEVVARRAAAASGVPSGLLETYERLRSRLDGVGAARLVGNRCDGCHLSLSSVELDRIRRLPDGEVYTCEQCSRILVPDL